MKTLIVGGGVGSFLGRLPKIDQPPGLRVRPSFYGSQSSTDAMEWPAAWP
jgi:hypothetical protein